MRVIAKTTLKKFWQQSGNEDAQAPLEAWHDIVLKADWKTPQEVQELFKNASIVANNRAVFNIAGNKYRLVVEIQHQMGIVWIKFLGTHAEYDKIYVETVSDD